MPVMNRTVLRTCILGTGIVPRQKAGIVQMVVMSCLLGRSSATRRVVRVERSTVMMGTVGCHALSWQVGGGRRCCHIARAFGSEIQTRKVVVLVVAIMT